MKPSIPINKQNVNDRIRDYVAAIPGAVSGNGGHSQTFSVASALVHGFSLSETDALRWMRDYNQRCDPAWSEAELLHKVRDAIKKPSTKGRGYLLGDVSHGIQSVRNCGLFTKGTKAQIQRLADSRPYSREGLEYASARGVLIFGHYIGQDVYGVTDETKRLTEVRRIDGATFPKWEGNGKSIGERKSHMIKGGEKKWPVGIVEAQQYPCIALFEGIPDFLEAHYVILWEGVHDRVAPVAMLSASPEIHTEALPYFKGKVVRIFPHSDAKGAGLKGAEKWRKQLIGAGAAKVDLFDFSPYRRRGGQPVNDFYEFNTDLNPAEYALNPALWRVMP